MKANIARLFHTSAVCGGRTACSIVPAVHHPIRFKKSQLGLKFPGLREPKSHITHAGFRPDKYGMDRLRDHYINTLESNLLLINYVHNQENIRGRKPRPRAGSTPYQVYQPSKAPYGGGQATKDIKPRTCKNVPQLKSISINCFVRQATQNHDLAVAAKLQLQQITGAKPETVHARTNVPSWTLRPGMPMGAKVEIKGLAMSQFVNTLCELVLPRSKTFTGISNRAGDSTGTIMFSLTSDDVRLFPEIEGNLELWPQTFGFDIFLHTSAQVDPEARTLLSGMGIPFKGDEKFPKVW